MKTHDYLQYDAMGLAKLIRNKDISAKEALNAACELADALNPKLNALTERFDDKAYALLSQASPKPPLYGVPCVLKDIHGSLRGTLDTGGSALFANNRSTVTNDYVKGVLASGLIPFAKTNVAELGLSFDTHPTLFGPCVNPLNASLMVGGSSGGSAAAVAAGIVPIATANDGGGSIRVPATCCGLFGFKPSEGLTPTGPDCARLWSGLATAHVITKSIRDSALMLDLVQTDKARGSYLRASELYPSALKVAVVTEVPVPVHPVMTEALDDFTKRLSLGGHECEAVSWSLDFDGIGGAVIDLIAANTYALLADFDSSKFASMLEPMSHEFYLLGKQLSAAALIKAEERLYQLTSPIRNTFDSFDVIMTPALAQPPLPQGQLASSPSFEAYLNDNFAFSPFTGWFNQTGFPAFTLPGKRVLDDIPVSVQFAAAWGQDELLFKLANQLQAMQN